MLAKPLRATVARPGCGSGGHGFQSVPRRELPAN